MRAQPIPDQVQADYYSPIPLASDLFSVVLALPRWIVRIQYALGNFGDDGWSVPITGAWVVPPGVGGLTYLGAMPPVSGYQRQGRIVGNYQLQWTTPPSAHNLSLGFDFSDDPVATPVNGTIDGGPEERTVQGFYVYKTGWTSIETALTASDNEHMHAQFRALGNFLGGTGLTYRIRWATIEGRYIVA